MIRTYTTSKLCPRMGFKTVEDAEDFDKALTNVIETEQGRQEFEAELRYYPSIEAAKKAIECNVFYNYVLGDMLIELVMSAEKMTVALNDLDNCYFDAFSYLLIKLYPEQSVQT